MIINDCYFQNDLYNSITVDFMKQYCNYIYKLVHQTIALSTTNIYSENIIFIVKLIFKLYSTVVM